jgi:thymidylate synthase (FAD)
MHNAKLISVSPDAEEVIMYCARVSNPENQDSGKTGLIRYCIKEHHWSPFEMANMVVEINTSRAISPQILRHRSFSFQEFSQRYANASYLFGADIPLPHLRRQDTKNRQASHDDLDFELVRSLESLVDNLYANAAAVYDKLLENGVAKECAREILPLGVPTRLYMNGTLRSWITYIALREKNGTQFEHQKIALSVKQIFCNQFPIIADALGGPETPWVL